MLIHSINAEQILRQNGNSQQKLCFNFDKRYQGKKFLLSGLLLGSLQLIGLIKNKIILDHIKKDAV